jgi:hypothetical protein
VAFLDERVRGGDVRTVDVAGLLALARAIEESRFEAAGEIAAALGLSPVALLGCQLSAMRWLCQVKEQSYL